MCQTMAEISMLHHDARRCDDIARQRFDQAKVSPKFEGQLIDQGVMFKIKADALRLEAARLLPGVPAVVI